MANLTVFQQEISGKLPEIQKKFNEPMAKHTSFRIGGPAEVMLFPKNTEELAQILKVSAIMDCKTAILGAGTNILAPDAGMSGMVICLKDSMDGMELLPGDRIRVGAGVTMARCAVFAAKHSVQGMEFAHGIPGTVGGGIYMNAGAYGGEMCQIVESVDVMRPDGMVETLSCEEMGFSYRHSRLEEEQGIVVSAVVHLAPGEESAIREKMQELMSRRKTSQPLDLPSAGSAFKRPVGGYAAALIDQAGLKGYRVGDAAVSEKHAGFVVNLGNATAAEVRELLDRVSGLVAEASGIRLEPEVRIW